MGDCTVVLLCWRGETSYAIISQWSAKATKGAGDMKVCRCSDRERRDGGGSTERRRGAQQQQQQQQAEGKEDDGAF
ncbi:hypothetical protein NQZ68_005613 [Dissostichus eleginoides]|nr:hypothetical protein NQZ68_005613 [Dissostichus eleginoides]